MTMLAARPQLLRIFTSMASPVELRVIDPQPGAAAALDRAEAVVREVARTCTRFDPDSALSRANREPDAFHLLPAVLAQAVAQAAEAHRASDGLFDPRVLDTLLDWGYDRTFAEVAAGTAAGPADLPGEPGQPVTGARVPHQRGVWEPVVLAGGDQRMVRPGARIDLGGIAKGLAVRWAAAELAGAGSAVLVDAGGDEMLAGPGPGGTGWRVGVEDPFAAGDRTAGPVRDTPAVTPSAEETPVLVLELTDLACATSSIRRRRWRAGGAWVHHLVDPRTARPGGAGLASVTVVHPDPAWAEVWSKTLFLVGEADVAREAERRGLAAAWVTADGRTGTSSTLDPSVLWRAR